MSHSEDLPPEPRPPSNKAAERLAVIVDAAERAALSVIDDAEKEARRYLEEAQVRADLIVADRLREAADLLERHRGELGAQPRLRPVEPEPAAAEEEEAEPAPVPAVEESVEKRPEEVEEPEATAPEEPPLAPFERTRQVEDAPAPRHSGSAAARLLATQMAVSGASRKEIEMRLRNGFEIEDTGEILDAILGPEE